MYNRFILNKDAVFCFVSVIIVVVLVVVREASLSFTASMLACGRRAHSQLPPHPLLLLPLLLLVWHSSLSLISAAPAQQTERPFIRILYPEKGEIFSGCNWINFTAVVQVTKTILRMNPPHTI